MVIPTPHKKWRLQIDKISLRICVAKNNYNFYKSFGILRVKGSLDAMIKLLLCDLEIIGSSYENNLL